MKLALQLAYKNLIGSGLRTWLNVGILSFSFVVIIFFRSFMTGWSEQATREAINWEFGQGHLINNAYDQNDPFTLQDGHGILPEKSSENLSPILMRQSSIYPDGRVISIILKGIATDQKALELPTEKLAQSTATIPAMIGVRMAKSNNLKEGDQLLLRWRDKNGTFDAANITIAAIFDTDQASVDQGQVWIPIEKLWEMTGLEQHATFFVANEDYTPTEIDGWHYESQYELLSDLRDLMQMENAGSSIFYLLLLCIALLAIFDTQVLSIFRRQKEIGTYISMGMTRWQVVKLFTIEGSMYSLMATVAGALYGIPIFLYFAKNGISMPQYASDAGIGVAIADKIYLPFNIGLILGTILLVVASATIVSFLPSRKIAKMDPVNALKGKLQ